MDISVGLIQNLASKFSMGRFFVQTRSMSKECFLEMHESPYKQDHKHSSICTYF